MSLSPEVVHTIGMMGAISLPFWNIPLIVKIGRRRSSKDISLSWTLGVFGCLWLMLPAGLASPDVVFRWFTLVNLACFSGVVFQVLRYH